jgi:hypothetical protein
MSLWQETAPRYRTDMRRSAADETLWGKVAAGGGGGMVDVPRRVVDGYID